MLDKTPLAEQVRELEAMLEADPADAAVLAALLEAEEALVKERGVAAQKDLDYWTLFWEVSHAPGNGTKVYVGDRTFHVGPRYPKSIPGTERTRKAARKGGLEARLAHGQAVLDGIGKLNAKAVERGLVEAGRCPCPSGTYSNKIDEIFAAIGRQNAAKLSQYCAPLYQGSAEDEYARVMAAKRAARQTPQN